MPCSPCAARARADQHRAESRRPVDARPLAWPAAVAAAFDAGLHASRRACIEARAWLATQPIGSRRLESTLFVHRLEQQLRAVEQGLLRAGIAHERISA